MFFFFSYTTRVNKTLILSEKYLDNQTIPGLAKMADALKVKTLSVKNILQYNGGDL